MLILAAQFYSPVYADNIANAEQAKSASSKDDANKANSVDSPNTAIEKIIISAKREGVPAHQLSASVNTLSSSDISAWNIQNSADLTRSFANVDNRTRSPMNASIAIRGVGAENWHINANQGVVQVLDESTLQGNYGSKLAMFDLQGIALYRGPQNGLFGINSTGGAIYFESNKPRIGDNSAYVNVRLGRDHLQQVTAAGNLSLSDTIAARFAVYSKQRDPLWKNLFNNTAIGSIDNHSVRAHFLWEPASHQSLLLTFQHGKDQSSRTPYLGIGFWDANGTNVENGKILDLNAPIDCPQLLPSNSASFSANTNCVTVQPFSKNSAIAGGAGDWFSTYDAAEDVSKVEFQSIKASYTHTFEAAKLSSVTSFDKVDSQYLESLSNNPAGLAFMPSQELQKQHLSQELRLSSLPSAQSNAWMFGAFVSQSDDYYGTVITRADNDGAPFGIVPAVSIEQDTTIASIFGMYEHNFNSQWQLSSIIRYTRNKQEGLSIARVLAKTSTGTPAGEPLPLGSYINRASLEALVTNPSGPCPPNVGGFPCELITPVEQTSHLTGGNLSLSYFANEQSHIYLQLSRGFLAGAFDTRALAAFAGTADNPVEPETLDAIELGYKYDGSTLLGNIAAFYYLWHDKQTFDVNNDGSPAFLNIPEATIHGIDADITWLIDANWRVRVTTGMLKSEVTDAGSLLFTPKGNEISYTPSWSHSLKLSYFLGWLAGDSVFNITNRYKSAVFYSASNQAFTESEAQSQWSLNWQHTFASSTDTEYQLEAGVENLFSKKFCMSLSNNGSLSYTVQCLPNAGKAQWYLGARMSF